MNGFLRGHRVLAVKKEFVPDDFLVWGKSGGDLRSVWQEVGAFLAKELRLVTTLVSFDRAEGWPEADLFQRRFIVKQRRKLRNRLPNRDATTTVPLEFRAKRKRTGLFLANECGRVHRAILPEFRFGGQLD